MVITFSTILLGLIALIRPLQRNRFFILNSALIIGAAYFIETHYFTASVFSYKTIMLFLVFQLISINVVTFIAYGVDKRAAVRGNWRVPEIQLHTLEFLGGWLGAYLAQRFFSPQNFQEKLSGNVSADDCNGICCRMGHSEVFALALIGLATFQTFFIMNIVKTLKDL